ncbi:MAG: hypothetical protein DCC65_10955 [Planctomycetota bacterium]|nr:MAG: hypothetical protein DCC65_10955 [Planctomycetota bacterium]
MAAIAGRKGWWGRDMGIWTRAKGNGAGRAVGARRSCLLSVEAARRAGAGAALKVPIRNLNGGMHKIFLS